MDRYPPAVQRPALLDFAAALGSRANALRRDECGDWAIHGRHGKVFAVPEGFQLVVMGWTTRGWNNAQRELAFAKLWQDGEEDGSLILNSLPVDAEGAPIRHWLGIPKRPAFTDEHLAKLRAWGVENARRNASTASPDGQIDAGGTEVAPSTVTAPTTLKPVAPHDVSPPPVCTAGAPKPFSRAAIPRTKPRRRSAEAM